MRTRGSILGAGIVVLLGLLLSCESAGSGSDTGGSDLISDPAALEGMEIIGGIMELVFEGGGEPPDGEQFPYYENGTYIEGFSVAEDARADRTVSLTVTISNLTPPAEDGAVPVDTEYNGTVELEFTLNSAGTQLTIAMGASISASGTDATFASLTVSGAGAVVPITEDGPGDPSSMEGTLTVDGTSYDMARIDLDAGDGDVALDPSHAHYFLMSYWVDGGTDRPQLVFSPNAKVWDTLDLSASGSFSGALLDGAIGSSGRMVVVGENGLIFSSDDGANWTRRGSGLTSQRLTAVKTNGTTWLAVGPGVILRSPDDGISWDQPWAGGPTLLSVVHHGGGNWRAMGAPPETIVSSTDDGLTWSSTTADDTNRPQYVVNELMSVDGDSRFVALTGSDNVGALYLGGIDDDGDSDVDWTNTGVSSDAFGAAAWYGGRYAVTSFNGSTTVYISTDEGSSWGSASTLVSLHGYPVDMTAIGNGFLMVTNMGGLARGSDDGTDWEVITEESHGSWGVLFRPED